MNRGAGTGLIGFGIVLVIIGAILDFAVQVSTADADHEDAREDRDHGLLSACEASLTQTNCL